MMYTFEDGIGEIEVVDFMGSDLSVVNSARISYGGSSDELTENDKKLISYLAENKHTSPFRHAFISFRVKVPEFVARQWYKHVVGCSYSIGNDFVNQGWNEISGRYKEVKPNFYTPCSIRVQSEDNKQCSEGFLEESCEIVEEINEHNKRCYHRYTDLLKRGVPREQARIVLPLSVYTEYIWTASLQGIAHFCALRCDSHAQSEIRRYAEIISDITTRRFPESFPKLMECFSK